MLQIPDNHYGNFPCSNVPYQQALTSGTEIKNFTIPVCVSTIHDPWKSGKLVRYCNKKQRFCLRLNFHTMYQHWCLQGWKGENEICSMFTYLDLPVDWEIILPRASTFGAKELRQRTTSWTLVSEYLNWFQGLWKSSFSGYGPLLSLENKHSLTQLAPLTSADWYLHDKHRSRLR